jgi:hypothetical protein
MREAFGLLLPTDGELPGWQITRLPASETEEVKRAMDELLNFDSAGFVNYVHGDLRVSIYAAYWRPGKMSQRLIASHTPDVCWAANGWVCEQRAKGELQIGAGRVLPVERRVFTYHGAVEHVLFVHLVEGRVLNYEGLDEPPWHAMFADLFARGFHLRGEQLFVRISSNRPFLEFRRAAPVELLTRRLDSFVAVK